MLIFSNVQTLSNAGNVAILSLLSRYIPGKCSDITSFHHFRALQPRTAISRILRSTQLHALCIRLETTFNSGIFLRAAVLWIRLPASIGHILITGRFYLVANTKAWSIRCLPMNRLIKILTNDRFTTDCIEEYIIAEYLEARSWNQKMKATTIWNSGWGLSETKRNINKRKKFFRNNVKCLNCNISILLSVSEFWKISYEMSIFETTDVILQKDAESFMDGICDQGSSWFSDF